MRFLHSQSLKPTVHLGRCSRVRFSGARCEKCVSACPSHAIRIAYPVVEIDDTCSGCGFCIPACPNEVFAFPSQTSEVTKNEDQSGTLCCSGLLDKGSIPASALPPSVIPCLGSISPAFILSFFLQEGKTLKIVTGSCDECIMKTGENQYRQWEKEICSLFEYLGMDFPPVKISIGSPAERHEVSRRYDVFQMPIKETRTLSRRDFFRHLRDHAVTSLREPVKESTIKNEVGLNHRGPTKYTRLLVEVFRRYAKGESLVGKLVPGFKEIHVDENCTGCWACANLCPTGSLAVDESQETVRLLWQPSHCSQCGLCFDVCNRKALHMIPCLDVNRITEEDRLFVKEFYRHICPECGNRFFSSGPVSSCSDCQKTGTLMEDLSGMIFGGERRAVQ